MTDAPPPVKITARSRVRRLFVDAPGSVGARARRRRWETMAARFPHLAEMTVIDLGGTVESWLRAPVRPAHVTVLNLSEPDDTGDSRISAVRGDACGARAALRGVGLPERYDLVFSNSVIEHVGGHAKRTEFAAEVVALAPRHWIQTPYRYFPVEPHWLFPGMQLLPTATRTLVAEHWPLVHTRPTSRADAVERVLWTELIAITEMQSYFPGSEVLRERALGLTKSIIAVAGDG